ASLLARGGDAKTASGNLIVQGAAFSWIESNQGDATTEYLERDYAGAVNDTCYDFFVRLGVVANRPDFSSGADAQTEPVAANTVATAADAANPAAALATRAPNDRKIFAQLEKIVSSLQVELPETSMLDKRPAARGASLNW